MRTYTAFVLIEALEIGLIGPDFAFTPSGLPLLALADEWRNAPRLLRPTDCLQLFWRDRPPGAMPDVQDHKFIQRDAVEDQVRIANHRHHAHMRSFGKNSAALWERRQYTDCRFDLVLERQSAGEASLSQVAPITARSRTARKL